MNRRARILVQSAFSSCAMPVTFSFWWWLNLRFLRLLSWFNGLLVQKSSCSELCCVPLLLPVLLVVPWVTAAQELSSKLSPLCVWVSFLLKCWAVSQTASGSARTGVRCGRELGPSSLGAVDLSEQLALSEEAHLHLADRIDTFYMSHPIEPWMTASKMQVFQDNWEPGENWCPKMALSEIRACRKGQMPQLAVYGVVSILQIVRFIEP